MTPDNETIQPIGFDDEVHQPFDVQAHSGQYAMWKLMAALAFLVALALLIFFVYQPGSRDRGDPVVISPNRTALKVPPADNTLDPIKDRAIYGAGGSNAGTAPTTTIRPEAPIRLPNTVDVIETTPPARIITPPQPQSQPQPVAPTPPPVQRPVVQPSVPTTPQYGTTGNYLVQVASLRSYEEAEATWNRITKKFTFLRGQPYDIKRVDLNEKGVYYRLRVDGLSSSSAAGDVCQRLQASGQACFKTGR